MVMLLFFLSNNLFFFHLLGNFLYVVCCIPIQFRTQCIRIYKPQKSLMTENDRDLNDRISQFSLSHAARYSERSSDSGQNAYGYL